MQDNGGWSALMHASSNGHVEIVKLLLDNDAQVNMFSFSLSRICDPTQANLSYDQSLVCNS